LKDKAMNHHSAAFTSWITSSIPASRFFSMNGYVVESLEASLWCFQQTVNYRDAVLMATNLGDDADTTAAITGQIAGAFYGEAGIPQEWLKMQAMGVMIGTMAENLLPAVATAAT